MAEKSDIIQEKKLLRACCANQPGAWDDFLDRYHRLIYYAIHRTCSMRHYHPEPDELSDLFNDVMVHFIKDDFKKLRLFRGDEGCTLATWIRTVTVRFTIDYLRQRARSGDLVNIEGEEIGLEVSLNNPVSRPDQIYEDREKDERWRRAVASLSESDRNFVEIYYGRGLSAEETAKIMDMSVKTVYSRINRLKAKLIEEIDGSGRK